MRKLVYAALVAAILSSCSSGEGYKRQIPLENDVDSLSYMLGITNTEGLMDYLIQSLNVNQEYMDEFYRGFDKGIKGVSDKENAYMVGVQIGVKISERIFEALNEQVFGDRHDEGLSKNLFIKGFVGKLKYPDKMSTVAAQKYIDENMMRIHDRAASPDPESD